MTDRSIPRKTPSPVEKMIQSANRLSHSIFTAVHERQTAIEPRLRGKPLAATALRIVNTTDLHTEYLTIAPIVTDLYMDSLPTVASPEDIEFGYIRRGGDYDCTFSSLAPPEVIIRPSGLPQFDKGLRAANVLIERIAQQYNNTQDIILNPEFYDGVDEHLYLKHFVDTPLNGDEGEWLKDHATFLQNRLNHALDNLLSLEGSRPLSQSDESFANVAEKFKTELKILRTKQELVQEYLRTPRSRG